MKKIVVVGSTNVDQVAKVAHLPQPGETVGNATYLQTYGGKGANQALAATRLGGDVTFVTYLGADSHGKELKTYFAEEGMHTDYIFFTPDQPTGTALILVSEESGENCIAVAPGANGLLDPQTARRAEEVIAKADIVLMQAEIPYETIREIAFTAHQQGVTVMVNPAPACSIDKELMAAIDVLIVNETEAAVISGIEPNKSNLDEVAQTLIHMGAGSVVITLGKAGAYGLSNGKSVYVPAFEVQALDATAAGDTFCGALAVVYDGHLTTDSLRFASAASALAVTRLGAQSSIPHLSEVQNFLQLQK